MESAITNQLVFVTGRQIIAARALAGWSRDLLGKKARISPYTVTRLEAFDSRVVKSRTETLQAVQLAFEGVKLRFTDTGGVDFIA